MRGVVALILLLVALTEDAPVTAIIVVIAWAVTP